MKLTVLSSVALLIAGATTQGTPDLSSCQTSCLTKIEQSSGCSALSCACDHVDEFKKCLKNDKCSQADQTSADGYISQYC